jgi:ABC-2 type transport system permease protein
MLRGLWKLTWLELKIFAREPLGLIGTIAIPLVVFIGMGRAIGGPTGRAARVAGELIRIQVPILTAIMMALSAVLSLVTIVSIYREGGILKRLRATPLRAHTILTAHVLVKLLFTGITVLLMVLAGRRYYPARLDVPAIDFTLALLFVTLSILSMGFLIASMIPTARFAQPIGSFIFYPMIALSGLFVPVASLPPALQVVARLLPLTYAVSLLRGILEGETWSAHAGDLLALAVMFLVSVAVSSRVFRWE